MPLERTRRPGRLYWRLYAVPWTLVQNAAQYLGARRTSARERAPWSWIRRAGRLMRILYVVHGFVPEAVGGVELHCLLPRLRARRAHTVGVLAWTADAARPDYALEAGRAGRSTCGA